jgi:hypothetical protein
MHIWRQPRIRCGVSVASGSLASCLYDYSAQHLLSPYKLKKNAESEEPSVVVNVLGKACACRTVPPVLDRNRLGSPLSLGPGPSRF